MASMSFSVCLLIDNLLSFARAFSLNLIDHLLSFARAFSLNPGLHVNTHPELNNLVLPGSATATHVGDAGMQMCARWHVFVSSCSLC
jgi:hypothetical protein